MRRPLLIVLFAAAVVLAACGGGNDDQSAQAPPAVTIGPTGPTGTTTPNETKSRERKRERSTSRERSKRARSQRAPRSKGGSVRRKPSDADVERGNFFAPGGLKFERQVTFAAARKTCKRFGVKRLAKELKVKADAVTVARKVSRGYVKKRRNAAYRGCLRGFSS